MIIYNQIKSTLKDIVDEMRWVRVNIECKEFDAAEESLSRIKKKALKINCSDRLMDQINYYDRKIRNKDVIYENEYTIR